MTPSSGAEWVRAVAPASVANVAIGFDILGFSVDAIGDLVGVRKTPGRGVVIRAIRGIAGELPVEPRKNTAGQAVLAMLEATGAPFGVEMEIEKGIPLSSGLGGSAVQFELDREHFAFDPLGVHEQVGLRLREPDDDPVRELQSGLPPHRVQAVDEIEDAPLEP